MPDLKGGDAAALVGGIALLTMFGAAFARDRNNFMETAAEHIVDGLVFAFKAMGVVLPIAGFFFLGNGDFSGQIMSLGDGVKGPAFLYDLVVAGQGHLPTSGIVTAFGILVVGMIAGLEGSGFSGLPLTGSLAGSLAHGAGVSSPTLAAIGQMGNIWSGGGTLVAWSSLLAVAGFARVPVVELARRCFLPVVAGLVVCTIFAVRRLRLASSTTRTRSPGPHPAVRGCCTPGHPADVERWPGDRLMRRRRDRAGRREASDVMPTGRSGGPPRATPGGRQRGGAHVTGPPESPPETAGVLRRDGSASRRDQPHVGGHEPRHSRAPAAARRAGRGPGASISSRIGRTDSTPLPAGSSRSQSS